MTSPPPSDSAASERAQALFAAWLVRAEAGEEMTLDALLAAHPAEAAHLRVLHEDWQFFAPLLGRAVPGRIDEGGGIVLAPLSGSTGEAGEAPSPELLQRLGFDLPESGRYRFRAKLGRGGGGVVLKVWDTKLNRALAMKVVLGREEERPSGGTPKVDGLTLSRFVDEARIASQLNHPGIVPVHELGLDESGRAYFTMKLVKGENLATVLEHVKTGHEGWNPTRALNVLLRVCESVAFAHEKGVIHRDLKPANIMVGRHGEVYVMDWGLARVLGEEDKRDVRVRPPAATSALHSVRPRAPGETPDSPLYTMDGDVVGTPAYMSPEQARGELARMGPASDVYAVGAMLYHLMVGHMPYVPVGAQLNNYAVWQRVQEGPPTGVASLAPRAPAELVSICQKAMARDLSDRYRDMPELVADLRAYLEGRVVRAHESGALAVARKWIRRNRVLSGSVSALVSLAVVLSLLWVDYLVKASRVTELETEQGTLLSVLHGVLFEELLQETPRLWPAKPDRLDHFNDWVARARMGLDQAKALESRRPRLLAEKAVGRATPYDQLLLSLLDQVGLRAELLDRRMKLIAAVAERLAHLVSLVSSVESRQAWEDAIASIASSKRYGGLTLVPQLGLLPLREDPRSGLWEFWHVLSGEKPALDTATDRWRIEPATGVVLVLIPGGEYVVGASEGDPYVNVFQDRRRDMPARAVRLAPFFLSKYELTQAQWERAGAENESRFVGATDPVERASWEEATEILARLDLELPTEAQWEAGARGGIRTRFYTGDEATSLSGHVVILPDLDPLDGRPDKAPNGIDILPRFGQAWRNRHEPVGQQEPNPFGLYDVVGNVSEWCRDVTTLDPDVPMREGDGLREPSTTTEERRVLRGGNFLSSWPAVRHSHRFPWGKGNKEPDTGLRPARSVR